MALKAHTHETKDPNDQQALQPTGTALEKIDYGDDAGAGMENITKDEWSIPFYRILQAQSPQCKPPAVGGLEGAKAGMIINMTTLELFDNLPFIPVHRDHNFPEWLPRNQDGSGGGFLGIRAADDPLVIQLQAQHGKFGKLPTPDGHELAEAFYLFGLMGEPDPMPGVIAFGSTQIKKYKAFMTRYMGIQYDSADPKNPNQTIKVTPPLWAHRWVLSTVYESKGTNSYYGWRIALVEEPPIKSRLRMTDPLYVRGRETWNLIKSGRMTADYNKGADTERQGGTEDEVTLTLSKQN